MLPFAREAYADAAEIALGPLPRGDFSLALARRFADGSVQRVADALWMRCEGHPLLLQTAIAQLDSARFPREVERYFEMQLNAAGEDAIFVAQLLALEAQLGIDDLVALLDWSLERVVEARDRIAERLKLHEHPSAKRRLAEHSLALGRTTEAAAVYLDAGRDFAEFAAWGNALEALGAGIALLDRLATSAAATGLLRELYLARGRALYETGAFAASLHSLDAALDLGDGSDLALRADALVTMGHALARLNHAESAWSAAQRAIDEARRAHDLRNELEAASLMARLLFNATRYDEAIECAQAAYERAVEAREWIVASTLAQRAADTARRQLKFAECFAWVQRQLHAAVLAGPVLEAQAQAAIKRSHIRTHPPGRSRTHSLNANGSYDRRGCSIRRRVRR
ncbi:MAG: hypothetical protein ACXWNK_04415 [Vulcanimicrobiaceae bacterium]